MKNLSLAWLLFAVICVIGLPYYAYSGDVKSYYPIYPKKLKYAWVNTSKWGGPPFELRLRESTCFMGIKAIEKSGDLVISWTHEEVGGKARKCEIYPSSEPIYLEDMNTGSRRIINVFQRVFPDSGPGLSLTKDVNLGGLISGFAAVPEEERRYTLSFGVRRVFKGSLPKDSYIQLPDIWVGKHHLRVPPLQLKKYDRSGDGWWYVPVNIKAIHKTRPTGSSFGGSSLVYKEADTWYEESSLVRLASSFRGDPFTYSGDWSFTKNKNESEIYGEIFIEVLGDKFVHMNERHVVWTTHNDTSPQAINFNKSKWQLRKFTTSYLSERLDHLQDYRKEDEKYNDCLRKFVVEIPDFNPRRLKVSLPTVRFKVLMQGENPDGYNWKVLPIEFKRR